jgi:phosphatidylinositol-3-phosphatase
MDKKNTSNIPRRGVIICIVFSSLISGILAWKNPFTGKVDMTPSSVHTNAPTLPHPNHVIFLWLENKDFDSIIGNSNAPYINSLIKKGTLFTNSHAISHPSYPNYVAFFSGDQNGVLDDACINADTLSAPNLYTTLKTVNKTFAWYSEDLPATGSKVCFSDYYFAKHNPTSIFSNVPRRANKRFADLPANYNKLENVLCISPNIVNDMHSGSVSRGDDWIKTHLSSLVDWCNTHNSIFVIYFDESGVNPDNKIPVIAVGEPVKVGFKSANSYDHYSWTKTVGAMFSAPDAWTNNLSAATVVTGCWK